MLRKTVNQVLKIQRVCIGSLNAAVVRVGELFREAIRGNAVVSIVAHNPPQLTHGGRSAPRD